MLSWITGIVNKCSGEILSSESLKDKKKVDEFCTTTKVLTVAAAIVAVAFSLFFILSGSFFKVIFGTALGGVGLTVAHDIYRTCENFQKTADRCGETLKSKSNEDLKNDLSKGTIFARPIISSWVNSRAYGG